MQDKLDDTNQNGVPVQLNDTFKINKTGLVYDPLMLNHKCEWDEIYPEKPDRIKKPFERCEFYGLTKKCVRLTGRLSTDDEIEKYHTSRVNQMMKRAETMTKEELMGISEKYDSMYFSNGSNKAARFALGSSLDLFDSIMTGKVDNGFAIIRPPGHHAMCDAPNGYCYFNNAAVVAKTAIEKYGMSRILIVDWDVHHGQGVQYAFYDDPRVLYYSMHRYDYGDFWPNLREGDFDYIGKKDGKGFNINVPLNKTGLGNSEYSAAFFNLLLPIAYEYKPELVIVASGYDAAIGCFEGRMRVTPAAYAHFLNALSCLTNGKLCVLLEGGYCIKSLSEGVALSVRALLGYPTPRVENYLKPDPAFVKTLMNLFAVLRPYWKCLQHLNDADSTSLVDYLKDWDKKNRENINFYDNVNPPEKFELTGFYPLWSDEDNIRLDKEIDELIKNTDLSVPSHRTCVCLSEKEETMLNIQNLDKGLKIGQENTLTRLGSVIKRVNSKECSNGLCIQYLDDSYEKFVLDALEQGQPQNNKILIVNISDKKTPIETLVKKNLLHVLITTEKIMDTYKNGIQLSFANDTALLTGVLRILMPIAYRFNPDLVFVYLENSICTAKSVLSIKCINHVLKLLCALANGNILLALEADSDLENMNESVNKIYDILLGESCESLSYQVPSEELQKDIKRQIELLKPNWDCFQFNEKLPH